MAASALKGASLEASATERNAIRMLKLVGWIYLLVSGLVALSALLLSLTSANASSSYPPSALFTIPPAVGVFVAVILFTQGGCAWAICQVGASIAESLIMIRKNTA
jgi:hypothetical protein